MMQNESKRGRPIKNKTGLSPKIIINTAKSMMIQTGKIPSIRAIATELNVDPMALYYYFKNKNELLENITTSIMKEITVPDNSEKWQNALLILCKNYLETLNRFNGLLQILLTMESHNPAAIFISKFELIINDLNLSQTHKTNFLNLLVDYLHGFSLAMSCNKTNTLQIDEIEAPLALLFSTIALKVDQN